MDFLSGFLIVVGFALSIITVMDVGHPCSLLETDEHCHPAPHANRRVIVAILLDVALLGGGVLRAIW